MFYTTVDSQGGVGPGGGGANDEREQTLNALLTELDGFEPGEGVILLAATNRPQILDPALTRPGRIDRKVSVPLPDEAGRLAILRLHARRCEAAAVSFALVFIVAVYSAHRVDPTGQTLGAADPLQLRSVARKTSGLSGAELANLVNESAMLAVRAGSSTVTATHLQEALRRAIEARDLMSKQQQGHAHAAPAMHSIPPELRMLIQQMMNGAGMGSPSS